MNRNYGYKFAYSDSGSIGNVCGEDYRGPEAFSEPETRAIRDFINKYAGQLKIVYNLHAWGNLFIHPFNYDTEGNSELNTKYYEHMLMYEEIWNETGIPDGNIKGNGKVAIQYDANGEASDWMLHEHGILAASPELGTSNINSQDFFIQEPQVIKEVVEENYRWLFNSMKKLDSQLYIDKTYCNLLDSQDKKGIKVKVMLRLKNKGFTML